MSVVYLKMNKTILRSFAFYLLLTLYHFFLYCNLVFFSLGTQYNLYHFVCTLFLDNKYDLKTNISF